MSGAEYTALAYAVVFVFVLVYVAIIAAKLARLQREATELAALVRERGATEPSRTPVYAARVPDEAGTGEGNE